MPATSPTIFITDSPREVVVKGHPILLTKKQHAIMRVLLCWHPIPIEPLMLYREAWGWQERHNNLIIVQRMTKTLELVLAGSGVEIERSWRGGPLRLTGIE